MLTMLEAIVRQAVDDCNGRLRATREFAPDCALSGAVFFDVAVAGGSGPAHRICKSTRNPTLGRLPCGALETARPQDRGCLH